MGGGVRSSAFGSRSQRGHGPGHRRFRFGLVVRGAVRPLLGLNDAVRSDAARRAIVAASGLFVIHRSYHTPVPCQGMMQGFFYRESLSTKHLPCTAHHLVVRCLHDESQPQPHHC